ncbi:MAG: hypothetical protein HYX39_05045 [Bacteroidetes bacterium]|nr:hypothetical protein [Bacteroidota bacterium]
MKPLVIIIAGFFLSCFLITETSCQKNTDCKATVKCVDSASNAVSNARVLLFATVKTSNGGTVQADVKADGTTDTEGQVRFTFKLPAIYDIRATQIVGTKTLSGTGIIKLEEGKTSEKTVTIK